MVNYYRIDWDEVLQMVNRFAKTDRLQTHFMCRKSRVRVKLPTAPYATRRDMLHDLYRNRFRHIGRMAAYLGISNRPVMDAMRADGIKMFPRGGPPDRGVKTNAILALENTAGMTGKEIAKKLGCSPTYAWRVLKEHGLSYRDDRPHRRCPEFDAQVMLLKRQGLTYREIGKKLDCHEATVGQSVKRMRIGAV